MSFIVRRTGWILTMQRVARIEPDFSDSDGLYADQWQELRETCIGVKHTGFKALPKVHARILGCQSDDALGCCWLCYVMTTLRNTQCQDTRDLVYASLSMAAYVLPTDILQSKPLRPDYSPENLVADVFTEVTRVIMYHTKSVNYLCWAGIGNGRDLLEILSWVPEYSARVIAPPMPGFRGFRNFDASRSRDSTGPQLDINGSTLTLHGAAAFDSIEDVCSLTGHEFLASHAIHEVLAFCSNLPELFHDQTRAEVLWRTLVGDTSLEGEYPTPVSWNTPFSKFVEVYFGIYVHKKIRVGGDHVAADALTSIGIVLSKFSFITYFPNKNDILECYKRLLKGRSSKQNMEELSSFDRKATPFLSEVYLSPGRRLFRTSNGTLGLGPMFCQKGDQIWILRGSHVPLLLRPVSYTGKFQLVGDCYLHGFMRGEMLDERWGLKEKFGSVSII